jgi:hypothetical protein
VQEDPSLLESPYRRLRRADEVVGEAGRFREPIPDGAGKDPASRKATQGWHAADHPRVGSIGRFDCQRLTSFGLAVDCPAGGCRPRKAFLVE